MPSDIFIGNMNKTNELNSEVLNADLKYNYPLGLNLKPGSDLHNKIVDRVMRRARASQEVMSERHDKWQKIDKKLTGFIDLDDAEKTIKDGDERKPMSVVIPLSYAVLQTMLTYWTNSYTNDDVIFGYEGTGPEDSLGALLLEKVVSVHVAKKKMLLALHTMWRDGLAYGIGPVHLRWVREVGYKNVPSIGGVTDYNGQFTPMSATREVVKSLLYEGNMMDNIDPYLFFPDPNVPVHRIQDGEWVSWLSRDNLPGVLTEEDTGEGDIFNARYLRLQQANTSILYDEVVGQSTSRDRVQELASGVQETKPVDRLFMYANIIPKDWGLGDTDNPEKWLFVVGGDRILLQAQPLSLNHNMYPVAVCAPEFDGHSMSPISAIELTFGLQEIVDWLMNSHVANVRKALRDLFVVDPMRVDIRDLKNPSDGGFIKLRRSAWGSGVRDTIEQMRVTDVTSQNIGDISFISDLVQKATGATDILQGAIQRKGEAKTAQEVRDAKVSAVSRLEKASRIGAVMAMSDIGFIFASHTQQFMNQDLFVKTIGTTADVLRDEFGITEKRFRVRPIDIMADFDVVVRDGFTQGGEYIEGWVQVYQILAQNEGLAQQYDMVRIFKHLARLMGAKNLDQFVAKQPVETQVLPDDIIARKVEQGRFIPIEGVA